MIADYSLYLVTDRSLALGRPLDEVVRAAVAGRVGVVQLREKETPTREFLALALALKKVLQPYRVPLIINDRLDIALACDAEGVHLGQGDMPYADARRLLGPEKIIGLSVERAQDVLEANRTDVDYIAASPVFGTPTKTDTAPALGLEGLRELARLAQHPLLAIGGVNETNASALLEAGAAGLCVVSAVMSATDPESAARRLRAIVDSKY